MELWFTEAHPASHRGLTFRVRRVLESKKSRYQQIDILETEDGERLFVLDGMVMLTTRDEFVYHEMLAHVALMAHPAPRRVLIVGGGDGGTAREVVKHPTVEHVDLVDIDEDVFELSRRHLPETAVAFGDPRVHLRAEDGAAFVKNAREPYDVVLVDSTEPIGPGAVLFGAQFHGDIHRALGPQGLMVCQSDTPFFDGDTIRELHRTIRPIYASVDLYLASVPVYPSGLWSFTLGTKAKQGARPAEPLRTPPAEWGLKYYSPEVHRACFALPPFVAELVR